MIPYVYTILIYTCRKTETEKIVEEIVKGMKAKMEKEMEAKMEMKIEAEMKIQIKAENEKKMEAEIQKEIEKEEGQNIKNNIEAGNYIERENEIGISQYAESICKRHVFPLH